MSDFIIYKDYGFEDKEEYQRWRVSFMPDTVYKHKVIEDEDGVVTYLLDCLYTDGDDGVVEFTSMSEVFDEEGVSIQLLNCNYCDISFKEMSSIARKLKKVNSQTGKKKNHE